MTSAAILNTYFLFLMLLLYGFSYVLQVLFSNKIVKKNYSLTPSVSVILSAFNEGERVLTTLRSIYNSNYNGVLKVLITDDCSTDDTWKWIEKSKELYPNLEIYKNPKNLGKALSLLEVLDHVSTEFVVMVDSDCTLAPNAITELMASYTSPSIGAVGGAVYIKNEKRNWIVDLQTLQYNRIFQLSKVSETYFGSVRCLSGALFSVRTDVYKKIAHEIRSRRWMGHPVHDSQDSFLTTQIVVAGYKAIYDPLSKVWTDVPDTFRHYFSQQTRWRRGSIRMFLWSIQPKNFIRLLKSRPSISLLRIFIFNVFIASWPILVIWHIASTGSPHLIITNAILLSLTLIVAIFSLVFARTSGEHVQISFITLFALPIWMTISLFFLTILAAFTLEGSTWETRA